MPAVELIDGHVLLELVRQLVRLVLLCPDQRLHPSDRHLGPGPLVQAIKRYIIIHTVLALTQRGVVVPLGVRVRGVRLLLAVGVVAGVRLAVVLLRVRVLLLFALF